MAFKGREMKSMCVRWVQSLKNNYKNLSKIHVLIHIYCVFYEMKVICNKLIITICTAKFIFKYYQTFLTFSREQPSCMFLKKITLHELCSSKVLWLDFVFLLNNAEPFIYFFK